MQRPSSLLITVGYLPLMTLLYAILSQPHSLTVAALVLSFFQILGPVLNTMWIQFVEVSAPNNKVSFIEIEYYS